MSLVISDNLLSWSSKSMERLGCSALGLMDMFVSSYGRQVIVSNRMLAEGLPMSAADRGSCESRPNDTAHALKYWSVFDKMESGHCLA